MESQNNQVNQVISILKWTFGLVPIIAGLDKFAHLLTDWHKYLADIITDILPLTAHTFMSIVGVIEVAAGILVLVKPKIGALVVSLWLVGIVINLLMTGQYYDIAVRDLVMSIAAFSLFLLVKSRKDTNRG